MRQASLVVDLDIEDNKYRNRGTAVAALPIAPIIVGYVFDPPPDLANAAERERLSSSAIKAFVNIAAKWSLSETQARGLLGGIASSTLHAWKAEPRSKKLDQDTLMRVSLIIGIYKALNIYFGKPWADRWVLLANRGSMFAGQAPIEYMLRHGQPGMVQVRRMLDMWCSGR